MKKGRLDPIPRELPEQELTQPQCDEPSLTYYFLLSKKGFDPSPHLGWLTSRRSGMLTKVCEQFPLDHEILCRELDVERTLVPKHEE